MKRWKLLPLLGAFLGLCVGAAIHSNLPQKYRADALIMMDVPANEIALPNHFNQWQRVDDRLSMDELKIVCSQAVLAKATELGRLIDHPQLLGKSESQIVEWLQTPELIDATMGSDDPDSKMIRIGVTTHNASLSGDLVQAIVAGYEDFVTRKFRVYRRDVESALEKFGNKLEKAKVEAVAIIDSVRKNKDLLFKEGEIRDPLADKALALLERIRILEDKQRSIESKLAAVHEGMKNEKSKLESLLLMLSQDLEITNPKSEDGSAEENLKLVIGALQQTLKYIAVEKGQCNAELEANSAKLHHNQSTIDLYLKTQRDLENLENVSNQLKESLRRLDLNQSLGQKILQRLDLPSMGSFAGPHLVSYLSLGGLLGFLLFAGLALMLGPDHRVGP